MPKFYVTMGYDGERIEAAGASDAAAKYARQNMSSDGDVEVFELKHPRIFTVHAKFDVSEIGVDDNAN